MTVLKLIPANQNRNGGDWSPDDFDVILVDSGETVGQIFKQTVAPGNRNEWFWVSRSTTSTAQAVRRMVMLKARTPRSKPLRIDGASLKRLQIDAATDTPPTVNQASKRKQNARSGFDPARSNRNYIYDLNFGVH